MGLPGLLGMWESVVMRNLGMLLIVCLMVAVIGTGALADGRSDRPVKLIFDTDIGNDIDDALALAMLHNFVDRGEVDLLGVTLSKDNPWAAVYVDVVNRFYGHPNIPIGAVRNGKTPEDGYVGAVASRKDNGRFVYPRSLKSGADAPEAVTLLRKLLAAQPDHSVTLVSVGFMTNMARLLDSKADSISPLTGEELARNKIKLYVMMAGAFSESPKPEYNVILDADAARAVFAKWPTPIIASGFEIGEQIHYPASSIESDFGYVRNHPVAEAYRAYAKMPYDRPTWDLTAVLYAVRPDMGYFGVSSPGRVELDEKNITRFTADESGSRRYLTVSPEQIARVREAFTWIVSSPPVGTHSGRSK